MTLWTLALLACSPTPSPEVPPAQPVVFEVPAPPAPAAVDGALDRALVWLRAAPNPERFDASIGAHETAALLGGGWNALREQRLGELVDLDHAHRRIWDDSYRLEAKHVNAWEVPTDGSRAHVNRVITEALYCVEHGWRATTEAHACGAMRDDGGYWTAHAAWALILARDNGCTQGTCIADEVAELERAQPATLEPERTLDIDLYAERLLITCLDHCTEATVDWTHQLIDAQLADGSWGVPAADEDPAHRYHTTMIAAWALAAWRAQR